MGAGLKIPEEERVSFREEVKDTSKEQEHREGVGDSNAELNDLLFVWLACNIKCIIK